MLLAKAPKLLPFEDILALSILKFLMVELFDIVPISVASRFDIVCPLPSRVLFANVCTVDQPLTSISAPSMIFELFAIAVESSAFVVTQVYPAASASDWVICVTAETKSEDTTSYPKLAQVVFSSAGNTVSCVVMDVTVTI